MSYQSYEPNYLSGLTTRLTEEELKLYAWLFPQTAGKMYEEGDNEWLRKLQDTDGGTKFRIKYFGETHPSYPTVIVGKNFASKTEEYIPPRFVAQNIESGNEILFFDLTLHGYNAVFCGEYREFRNRVRAPDQVFTDETGNDVFEIFISVSYQIDFDEEFEEEVDAEGLIDLEDEKLPFESAKANSFDWIRIHIRNASYKWYEIINFELA